MQNHQIMRSRASLVDEALKRLEPVNIGDVRRNVEWMLCELLNCNRASLYAHPEAIVPEKIVEQFQEMIERRLNHEPLQYILGYTDFCGLRIAVTPDVLIPRPETELLVEQATQMLKTRPSPVVLDIGSGSGCIPISIKHFNPHARVFSCDISRAALELATTNARTLGLDVSFFACDILKKELPANIAAPFDLIVSNPPYIPTEEYQSLDAEVLNFEPRLALDSGDDPLLFYRVITETASTHLAPGGYLLLETHCDYAQDTASLLRQMNFVDVEVLQDLAQRDRIVLGKRA